MAYYDFDYTMQILRQAIDFAETERDFVPLRKWANEVEKSSCEMKAIASWLNHPAGKDFLLVILQWVAAGSLSPEEASRSILLWLNSGQMLEIDAELVTHYQFA